MGLFNRSFAAFHKTSHGPQELEKGSHNDVKWIDDPFRGAKKGDSFVFAQRHGADTLELFFDLFFVANLATFTSYHAILDLDSFGAYVGFFAIIWSTWFQITLHDVRFSRDSVYERICKVVQMTVFVGFALVGSKFQPTSKKATATANFRVLCYNLGMSRLLFGIQYLVVLCFSIKNKAKKVFLPLILCMLTFFSAAATFFVMVLGFDGEAKYIKQEVFAVWWVVQLLEAIAIIAVSCKWRTLSFKATHIVERMGLLTLIVIGEGAIGITKTITRIMGKSGPTISGSFIICCSILILVFFWMLYFDNQPKQHYGTIRQQIWSVLHFPLHLGIVGVVEGAQQMTLAHYTLSTTDNFRDKVADYCSKKHYDGVELRDALMSTLSPYAFEDKPETYQQSQVIFNKVYTLGNTTGVCSVAGLQAQNATNGGFVDYDVLVLDFTGALFAGNGAKIPKELNPTLAASGAFKIAFQYYWMAFAVVLICSILFLRLVRKSRKADLFDNLGMITRAGAAVVSIALFGYTFKTHNGIPGTVNNAVSELLGGLTVVPLVTLALLGILSVDQLSRKYCNRKLKRQGLYVEPPAHGYVHEEHELDDQSHDARKEPSPAISEGCSSGYAPVLAGPPYGHETQGQSRY
ncbi:hypothetical protein BLS_009029 [Venturia inaequalis]|uniref:Uncharacterized protein n=1 Tax=Venturia inaequalis TaxID=5025 RepID=A0A8H3ZHJ5_VENIN|nr:hypothetical protein EG328_010161 [Venturia inaequalis]KAE9985286.1 hypothetical protein BLS_009029 [Venturia inaequalis]KAE9993642.1 hypothetical protein EG327_003906 [Venturia inaequalis]